MADEHAIVTPEAVVLQVEPAGLGSRAAAGIIDLLIQWPLAFVLVFAVATVADAAWAIVLLMGLAAFLPVAYGGVFEGLWNGRTPGKRAVRLRVVATTGAPPTWQQVAIRNIFRVIDQYLLVGIVLLVFTPRSQRLGDLAASTVVVREGKEGAPPALALAPDAIRDALAHRLDTSAVGAREYALLRDFLLRRFELAPASRTEVAARLAGMLRSRVPLTPDEGIPDELLIEAVVVGVRRRGAVEEGAGKPAI